MKKVDAINHANSVIAAYQAVNLARTVYVYQENGFNVRATRETEVPVEFLTCKVIYAAKSVKKVKKR